MANSSCGVFPVTEVGAACSGNGRCSFGQCVCDDFWFGESDFQVTTSLQDCQINVILIQVLWALFLVIHVGLYVRSLPKLKWLWEKHSKIVATNKAAGKKYTLFNNRGLLSLVPYVAVGWWLQVAYAITKIVNQEYKLGGSIWLTIFYIIWRGTFYYCCDSESLITSTREHYIRSY